MKRSKLLAKYSTMGLYLSTLGYLIFKHKLSLRNFFFATSYMLGVHLLVQYSISKYYLLKFKKLVI
jgi:hypothetical protein